jgi:bifunctional non-homologous end joining protein LigD
MITADMRRSQQRFGIKELPPAKPAFRPPMKALLTEDLPRGPEWEYELKFDGIRAQAIKNGSMVELVSRAGNRLTQRYPELAACLKKVLARETVLDGEIVAVDERGRSSFQLLQSFHQHRAPKRPLLYYMFDLLQLEGSDLTSLPLWRRKELAKELVTGTEPRVLFSAGIRVDSARLLREMKARGLEGIVAKKRDSVYEVGRRSGAWLKFKLSNEQEFVIGGYTQPQGGRTCFGALLVGYYDKSRWMFAGKVGTGFDQRTLQELHARFKALRRRDCPFANLPERLPRNQGLTAGQMRGCTWLEPVLVCQGRFAEWTRDHHLRQPAYLGLREDKHPDEVVRENTSD